MCEKEYDSLMYVYCLIHTYEYGKHNDYDRYRILGVYDSVQAAKQAAKVYHRQKGFSEFSFKNFGFTKVEIDKDSFWETGFFKVWL